MPSKRPSHDGGFTIIETLIVLATAGLILLIVFMAIPALQRNSRNNQRKQDVQAVLEAISNYALNHGGNFLDCGHASFASCIGNGNLLEYSHLSYYRDNDQAVVSALQPNESAPSPSDPEVVYVYNHQKCQLGGVGSTPRGAGYSDVVALYAVETSSGTNWRCQQL
ncbi:MAG TPA: type II secretion system protein [Candidatus Saccharimonadales bacterium]|nr:type II secretion system protein [Candidatus Saccharimonadales bacterium]